MSQILIENSENSLAAFSAYIKFQNHIYRREVSTQDTELIKLFVKTKDEKKIIKYIHDLSCINSGESSEKLYRGLYRNFILLSPSSDVIFGYLKKEQKGIFEAINSRKSSFSLVKRIGWKWKTLGEIALVVYDNTGEERFLEFIVSTFDQFLTCRDSDLGYVDQVRNRIVRSWGTFLSLGDQQVFTNEITVAGLIIFPIAKFCQLILHNKNLKKKYNNKAYEYLQAAQETLAEFFCELEYLTHLDACYFRCPITGEIEPLNHTSPFGACLAYLYTISGDDTYRLIFRQMSNYFLSAIVKEDNGSYSWGYRPTPDNLTNHRPEQLWKAITTISLPLAGYECGIAFSQDHIEAIIKTFKQGIYISGNRFNIFISPRTKRVLKREKIRTESRRNRVQSLASWIRLSDYDPMIKDIIEKAVYGRHDLFPMGWFGMCTAVFGYAYRFKGVFGNRHIDANINCPSPPSTFFLILSRLRLVAENMIGILRGD